MPEVVTLELGDRTLSLETGRLAKQADASVLARYGDTVVLVTVVWRPSKEKRDFLPLLVEYREQAYAAGKIPGGFFKREGRPREREILYSRAIDRSIRPRFPKGMMDEVEVVAFLMSYDMENEGVVPAIIGASQALLNSEIPFDGPIGAVRVGYIHGEYVLNPTNTQMQESAFDLLVVGTPQEVSMIEFGGHEVPEDLVLGGIRFAQPYIEQICELQMNLQSRVGKPKAEPTLLSVPEDLAHQVRQHFEARIAEALRIPIKKERNQALQSLEKEAVEAFAEAYPDHEVEIKEVLYQLTRELMRRMILEEGVRIDGRGLEDIRPISIDVSVLPRTHGSALFTRGETQALVVTTLGTAEDEQRLSELEVEETKRFMLHYNFPPFSTGEIKPLRGPSRREIGHGALAEKALAPLIPPEEAFPYTIRVVSDILESNGSSSMATVCGGSLSLMDAGVPVKAACAGISIGLIHHEDHYLLLTDILGDEDHYGDMDFKVAGTRKGITAIQLDLKILGLPLDVVEQVLQRARKAREFILDTMDAVLAEPRKEISRYAPKVIAIPIHKDKIGTVIGPGGKTIRGIIDKTQTKIDIDDAEGKVLIAGPSMEAVEEARRMIEELIQDVEVGQVYMGKVVKITPFGAFVEILPGKDGLVHISELAHERVKRVEDVLKVGDKVLVKVIGIDEMGRIKLSRKQALSGGLKKIKRARK